MYIRFVAEFIEHSVPIIIKENIFSFCRLNHHFHTIHANWELPLTSCAIFIITSIGSTIYAIFSSSNQNDKFGFIIFALFCIQLGKMETEFCYNVIGINSSISCSHFSSWICSFLFLSKFESWEILIADSGKLLLQGGWAVFFFSYRLVLICMCLLLQTMASNFKRLLHLMWPN